MTQMRMDGGIGFDGTEIGPFAAAVPRFLQEFTLGRGKGRFAGIDHAAGRLQRPCADAEAVLVDHDREAVGGQRDDVDPVDRLQHQRRQTPRELGVWPQPPPP